MLLSTNIYDIANSICSIFLFLEKGTSVSIYNITVRYSVLSNYWLLITEPYRAYLYLTSVVS